MTAALGSIVKGLFIVTGVLWFTMLLFLGLFGVRPDMSLGRTRVLWALVMAGPVVVLASLGHGAEWLSMQHPEVARPLLGSIVLAFVSASLFWIKVKALRVYACLELSFAILVSAQSMYNLHDTESPLQIIGLMAAVYLTIRGLDNFKKDVDERKLQYKDESVGLVARIEHTGLFAWLVRIFPPPKPIDLPGSYGPDDTPLPPRDDDSRSWRPSIKDTY